jgi:hypothetical protein
VSQSVCPSSTRRTRAIQRCGLGRVPACQHMPMPVPYSVTTKAEKKIPLQSSTIQHNKTRRERMRRRRERYRNRTVDIHTKKAKAISPPAQISQQPDVPKMSWIARTIVLLCFLWVLSFPLFGGSQWGKDTFTDLASHVFPNDKKGGVPILMLAVPVLIAASISSLFATKTKCATNRSRSSSRQWVRTIFPSQNMFGLCFLLLPCTIYVVACIRRHLYKKGGDYTSPEKLGEIGNAFAMMATVVLSWLLVPVSRLGPIGSMLGWETISMTQFHIWSGRLIVGGSCVHGFFHIVRWIQQGEALAGILIPPVACWKDSSFEPTCQSSETECTCYYHFRNFTGLLAVLGLLVIGISSRYSVRRKTFERFSLLHGVFTPLTLVAILLHYNRAILYASGGGLYYLASNFPIWIEKYRQQPIKVVSVERLESQCQTRPCVSVTLEVSELAIQRYRPGVYGYLKAPSISKVAHPFSINIVPHRNQIRIVFQTLGMFTQRLESQLISSNPPKLQTLSLLR